MELSAFDYDLPDAAIGQRPIEPRDAARLLIDRGPSEPPQHAACRDLPSLVGPGDVVVVNDTRVRNARLHLTKPSGGAVEVLLLDQRDDGRWEALVRSNRPVAAGTELTGPGLQVTVEDVLDDGVRLVRVDSERPDDAGEVPLPPYIHEVLADPSQYQTVYYESDPRRAGVEQSALRSVAAPTAGLHLTDAVLERCVGAGARVERVRLAVGLGTFRPIQVDRVEDHRMHAERFSVPPEVLQACATADRVVAVGTTVVRALESAAAGGPTEGRGERATELFIHGDYPFRVVDVLLTNFHVPRSSLLVMIDAFVGPRWRRLYETALADHYRFLSFGDAMLLDRRWGRAS